MRLLEPRLRSRTAAALTIPLGLLWLWAAHEPSLRFHWFLENLLVFATVPILVALWRRKAVSDLTWVLVAAFYALHIVGTHWTYSNVPWPPWERWGFERNHYDRLVHFAYGLLLTYPIREALGWHPAIPPRWAWVLALQLVLTSSAFYEILEWIVAEVVDPTAGAAFLGTQGDEFDAVKDMALALLGGLLAAGFALASQPRRER